MPPKAPPTAAQLHETFKEQVDDFDMLFDCVETTGDTPDNETLSEMDSIRKTVRKIASDMAITPKYGHMALCHYGSEWGRYRYLLKAQYICSNLAKELN